MNAHVIRIQGSAWRPRKGGSVKLVIEVRPETQAQWVKALEMFKQRPELSVTVVAPKLGEITHGGITHLVSLEKPLTSVTTTSHKGAVEYVNMQGYSPDGMPKADVDCPVPGCDLLFEHEGDHSAVAIVATPLLDCPKGNCGMTAGHKGKCVKKKVKA